MHAKPKRSAALAAGPPSAPTTDPNAPTAPAPRRNDPWLTDHDLAADSKTPPSRWQKLRMTNEGPPFVRFGRLVRYRQSDYERWKACLSTFRSTSDPGRDP